MSADELHHRKLAARAWFEQLRDEICTAFEQIEVHLPAGAPLSDRPTGRFAEQHSIGRQVVETMRHAWSRYWTRRAECAAIAVLYALDDRALKDIGLDRSEVESVVYGDGSVCCGPAPGARERFRERRVGMHP